MAYTLWHDLRTALSLAAQAARRSDLVAVWREADAYRLSVQAVITVEAINALKDSAAFLILVKGVPSRLNMSAGELATWHDVVRDANAWLN